MKEEVFLPIVEYNGYYQVSDKGQVRSLNRQIMLESGGKRMIKGCILKQKKNKGYLSVRLSIQGVATSLYVHRLVAGAFIDNPKGYAFVNHRDGNPSNNYIDNLEWVDHRQNVKHAYDIGLNSNQGGSHSFAVGVIDNTLRRRFDTIKEWCEAIGINYSTGRNILNGYNTSKKVDVTKVIILKPSNNGKSKQQ